MSERSRSPVAFPSKPSECPLCGLLFDTNRDLEIHIHQHISDFHEPEPKRARIEFPICEEVFSTRRGLITHFKCHDNDFKQSESGEIANVKCLVCESVFHSREEMESHAVSAHPDFWDPEAEKLPTDSRIIKVYRDKFCTPCSKNFSSIIQLQEHIFQVHPDFYHTPQVGGEIYSGLQIPIRKLLTSLNIATKYKANFEIFECGDGVDETHFLRAVKDSTFVKIQKDLIKWKKLKVFFSMKCKYTKPDSDPIEGFTTSFSHLVYGPDSLLWTWETVKLKMSDGIENFTTQGSGWTLDSIQDFRFVTTMYQFTKIGTYIEIPFHLSNTNSLLNIDNSEISVSNSHNKCFLWSVLAHDKVAGIPASNRNRHRKDKLVSTYSTSDKINKVKTTGIA